MLLQSQWQLPYSIFVGINKYTSNINICDQAEKVEIAYEFYKNLLQEEEIEEDNRHEIQRCNHDNNCKCGACSTSTGLCESYCSQTETCSKNYEQPQYLMCCPNENVVNGICCAGIDESGQCCQSGAVKCCPSEKPLIGANGTCYECNITTPIKIADENDCKACLNRTYENGYCVLIP